MSKITQCLAYVSTAATGKRAQWFMYISVAVVSLVLIARKTNPLLTIFVVLSVGAIVPCVVHFIQRRYHVTRHGKELSEPFCVEVLLDGTAVAILSEREFIEMFWRRYKITPKSAEAAGIIANDSLWEGSKFTFRDPTSGMVCSTGFAGGSAPFVRDGHVSLRGLYFKTESPNKALHATADAPGS